jgi:putative redox protein
MKIDIEFPGNLRVAARVGGFLVTTDQSSEHGGGGSAPEPFELFLASLGACAGTYALRFCQERAIETWGLGLSLYTEPDPDRKRLRTIHLEISLPVGFPERYRAAILRAVDQCAVKRHMLEPPGFTVTAQSATAVGVPLAPAAAPEELTTSE